MSSRKTNPFSTSQEEQFKPIQSFEEIVRDYKKQFKCNVDGTLKHYQSLNSNFNQAIADAAFAKDERGKRHGHQRRLKNEALSEVHQILKSKKSALKKCDSFEQVFELVEKHTLHIKGIGPLMVYDTAHRIGATLGYEPQKVYLHAGTRKGANFLNLGKGKSTLDKKELPKAFQKLKPHEIEDCLCIYKSNIQKIVK